MPSKTVMLSIQAIDALNRTAGKTGEGTSHSTKILMVCTELSTLRSLLETKK